jgi:hypothetical protein
MRKAFLTSKLYKVGMICAWWHTPVVLSGEATWEAEIGKIVVPVWSSKKVLKIPSQPILGSVACVCHPSYVGG